GAAALDLTRMAPPAETLRGARTLNGRAATAMRGPVAEEGEAEPASRWPIYVGAGAVGIALAAGGAGLARPWWRAGPPRVPSPDVGVERPAALRQALVTNEIELARADLANKDYKPAMSHAQRALALDRTSVEARQVLEQAERTQGELDEAAREARQAFDAGDT